MLIRKLLAAIFLAAVILSGHAYARPRGVVINSSVGALYNVTDPITTAQGELVFTVWRKYFFQAGSVSYSVGGGTAVNGVDYDGSLSALTGTLSFDAMEVFKHVRIQTFGTGGAGNKPASGAAQVTLGITLSNPIGGRIDDATATGNIQSGPVFYYAAAGAGSTCSEASPCAYADATNGVQAKITASAVAGTMLRLKRGDTWTLTSASGNMISVGATKGGTVANPMILGAYGSGVDPIITNDATYSGLAYFIALGSATSGSNATGFIVEDLILQPGAATPVARDFIRNTNGTVNAQNRVIQRITMRDPGAYNDIGVGINLTSAYNFTIQFNEISDVGIGYLQQGTTGFPLSTVTFLGNYVHDVGRLPIKDWGMYTARSTVLAYANKFQSNIQNVKLRSGDGTTWRWNYFDQTGTIGKATVTAATNAAQSVFTISQDLTNPIPARQLRVGQYFTLQGFSGAGWTTGGTPVGYGGNAGYVIITADLGGGQYQTNWDTSSYGAFGGGTPTVYSGGNLNVAFGYDTVSNAAEEEAQNCVYENNVQIGSSGFGFGVAESGVPAWGQGVVNFAAQNNLVIINQFSPQGANTGQALNFNSPYMNGVYVYNNTFVIDGLDYYMLFMPFTQTTGGNVGPIGPVVIKNNIFKRLNVAGAATFLATYGLSSIPGATVIGKITQDYNLWNDSTANKFASVNSGSTYATLASFVSAFPPQEASGVSASVSLSSYLGIPGVLPPNGSPTYGAGQSGLVSEDFIGSVRPSTPSLGAIQVSP